MSKYALIENGTVINVVLWDGVEFNEKDGTGWSPPESVIAVKVKEGEFPNIGLGYVDGVFEQEFPDEVVIPPVEQHDS
ncbi:hypothetical protein FFE93_007385 [Yersinia sp. KBS0713]|uniref:hypothetical protein n=1 Tax=Yersinia TaxID=629 RepID=UPI00110DD874|nr:MULTISPECIES: hypothetical protein [Yersinia]QDW32898.1 hypothetical protein FFE93_007385 [Yersinia sp. KBS0713]